MPKIEDMIKTSKSKSSKPKKKLASFDPWGMEVRELAGKDNKVTKEQQLEDDKHTSKYRKDDNKVSISIQKAPIKDTISTQIEPIKDTIRTQADNDRHTNIVHGSTANADDFVEAQKNTNVKVSSASNVSKKVSPKITTIERARREILQLTGVQKSIFISALKSCIALGVGTTGQLTRSELAESAKSKPGSISGSIDRLQDKGLLFRECNQPGNNDSEPMVAKRGRGGFVILFLPEMVRAAANLLIKQGLIAVD